MPDSSAICRGFISKDLDGTGFFENFTFVLHPIVRYETDKHRGAKTEMDKLSYFAAVGRTRFEDYDNNITFNHFKTNDLIIIESAKSANAILLTADKHMKAIAVAKDLFVMEIT